MFFSTFRRVSDAFVPSLNPDRLSRRGTVACVEPRAAPRHETEILAKLCVGGDEHDCTIRNVSVRGMTVALDGLDLDIGTQVIVMCDAAPALCGTIRSARGGAFGIEVVKPISLDQVYAMRQSMPAGMRPRAGRARVKLPAVARFADQSRKIEVLNLSVGGLMMSSGLAPKPGQRLMIEFSHLLPVSGHVRWSSVGTCGVMFSQLLPITAAEELARRARLPEGWLDELRMVHRTDHEASEATGA